MKKMTSREMYQEYLRLLNEKGLRGLDGISLGSTKATLQNGIDCLNCEDEKLDEYLEVVKTVYPAIYETIKNNGNFKTHKYNRLFVFNNARMILKSA